MARRRIGRGERERRKRLVRQWRSSGQSAAEFAKRHSLGVWALYSWAKQSGADVARRRPQPRRSVRRAAADARFIPVHLVGDERANAPALSDGVVEIVFRGGDVVRLVGEVSAQRLRVVVAAVREAC